MINLIYPLILCASAHATSKVFIIAENAQSELAMTGRVRGDGRIREWKLEFRLPDVLLPASAPVNATVELFAEEGIILPLANVQKFRTAPEYSDLPMRMSFAQNSDMANFNLNAMLLPQGEKHLLITNVDSPYRYCDNMEIVGLVPGSLMPFTVTLQDDARTQYRIPGSERFKESGVSLSGETKSFVPIYMYEIIAEKVRHVGCSDRAIATFPRIEYRAGSSVFYMNPEDYVERIAGGGCEMKIQGKDSETTWGRNMLKKFGIMIDYRMPRYWICNISPVLKTGEKSV